MYKLIILSPSAGGKSSLMRYLREYTDLIIAEMDEELVKLNNNEWPLDDNYRNSTLVPQVSRKIISMDKVVYLSSYLPEVFAKQAKQKGFTIALIEVSLEQLQQRNKKRMSEEKYESVAQYFDMQLNGIRKLADKGLIDKILDGHKSTEDIAEELIELVSSRK